MPVLDYAPPTASAGPSAAYRRGVRHVRRAVWCAVAAGGLWYAGFLALGVRERLATGRWPDLFEVEAALLAIALVLIGLVRWVGPPTLWLAFSVVHAVAGRRVPREVWNDAAFDALWRLPWATAAGAVLLFAYWAVEAAHGALGVSGGLPGDLVAGVLGNALGAWCYLPIIWRWGKLDPGRPSEGSAPPRHPDGDTR